MRTLEEIEQDLQMCEQYVRTGTLQAALKFCNDLRLNMIELTQHLREMQSYGPEGPVGLMQQPEERDDE